jgi:uncharacterized protein YcbK (DUF882 family)
MLRLGTLGAAVVFALSMRPAPASAGDEPAADDAAAATQSGAGDDAAEPGDAQPAQQKRQRRRSRRGKKAPIVSGRVVPDDQLRQDPLPRPSGALHLKTVNGNDEAVVNLYNEDGSYDLAALQALNHVLRCRRTDTEKPIDPRLLTILSHVNDHYPGKTLEIVSGYRNQRKKTSNHYKAEASDIRIQGVSPKKLRAFVETLDTGGMGIGLYPRSGFVHIDVRALPSYRWIDYSPPTPDSPDKRPPRGWKRKKLQS